MRILLFGATGMIGSGVLIEALRDPANEVVSVGRTPSGRADAKLEEIVHDDFFDYTPVASRFAGIDACFFCLGVSAAGMSEADYSRITHDLTLAAARAVLAVSPGATFCYVSGAGTDSTGKSRQMWARVKGRTENALLQLSERACMFRPGYIQPVKGVRSKTALYRAAYAIAGPFYPLLVRLFRNHVMTSEELGRAMLRIVAEGHPARILEARDIIALARAGNTA